MENTPLTEIPASDFLTPVQAAKICPGNPSSNSVWRWMREGVKVPAGRLYLRHLRVGGKLLTTGKWLMEFLEYNAESHKVDPQPVYPTVRAIPASRRAKQIQEAMERLAKA